MLGLPSWWLVLLCRCCPPVFSRRCPDSCMLLMRCLSSHFVVVSPGCCGSSRKLWGSVRSGQSVQPDVMTNVKTPFFFFRLKGPCGSVRRCSGDSVTHDTSVQGRCHLLASLSQNKHFWKLARSRTTKNNVSWSIPSVEGSVHPTVLCCLQRREASTTTKHALTSAADFMVVNVTNAPQMFIEV